MNFLVQFALGVIVKWAANLTKDDLNRVFLWVCDAEKRWLESTDKKAFVMAKVKTAWPSVAGWAVNLLIELGVAKLKKIQP